MFFGRDVIKIHMVNVGVHNGSTFQTGGCRISVLSRVQKYQADRCSKFQGQQTVWMLLYWLEHSRKIEPSVLHVTI